MRAIFSGMHVQWRWAAALTAAYFAVLLVAIGATLWLDLKISTEGWFSVPTSWALFLYTLYYGMPFVAAFAAGVLLRPFRVHFLAVLCIIFAMHGVYSGIVATLHASYSNDWARDVEATERADWRIVAFSHALEDADADDLIDGVKLTARLDPGSLPPGDYSLSAELGPAKPSTSAIAPVRAITSADFQLTAESREPFDIELTLGVGGVKRLAVHDEIEARLVATRWKHRDEKGKSLIAFCRWAAFFCRTSFAGNARAPDKDLIKLAPSDATLRFSIPLGAVQRKRVVFQSFAGDHGRDLDGDGLFDELVITLKLDSIYQGPVFFQAYLANAGTFLPIYESRLDKGNVAFNYVIDGALLRGLDGDGPYTIKNFIMMNNSPYCPQGQCPHENQPMFSVYLDSYTTESYRAEQFE